MNENITTLPFIEKTYDTAEAGHTSTWNVIDEKHFRERLNFVFQKVAKSLSNTLGPYGSTTIIEKFGEMHVTKDGWNVLKNIRFNDVVDNNLMALLLRISAQVVIQVGDGSTSSIVAANEILKMFENNCDILAKYRPKDLIQKLNSIVEVIISRIYENATKIDEKNLEEVYRIAYIATNGDDGISEMIRSIYEKTNNPTIEYRESKTNETVVEITNGYTLNDATYLDVIFTTNDDGTCVINKPYILMFDYKIDVENSLEIISRAASIARDNATRLVVIAPHYDRLLLDHIRRTVNAEYRDTRSSLCVYCRASLISNMSQVLYNDFAVMAGADILHEQFDEESKKIEFENILEHLGSVEKIVINDKSMMITGFTNRNEAMYNKILEDANAKYSTIEEDYRNKGIVDTAVTDAKNRLTKLRGSMGIIHVGGASTLEKKANFDLVEDAIRACESAFKYGYNIGGNLIIPFICQDIVANKVISDEDAELCALISEAFLNVYAIVLKNKFGDTCIYEQIIDEIMNDYVNNKNMKCYDLTTDTYTTNVINSCRTDIEILRGAISVISLLYTSNQYVSIIDANQR